MTEGNKARLNTNQSIQTKDQTVIGLCTQLAVMHD